MRRFGVTDPGNPCPEVLACHPHCRIADVAPTRFHTSGETACHTIFRGQRETVPVAEDGQRPVRLDLPGGMG